MTQVEFNSKLVRMQGDLRSFAYNLTKDQDKAKDLMQDIFLKAMENRDTLESHGCPEAWLRIVMRNYFINGYRNVRRHNNIVDYTSEQAYINQRQDENFVSGQSELEAEEINKCIESLSDKIGVSFRMYIDGYMYREIADILSLPINTVKARIFRARERLMAELKDYVD